jgi:hypothetical protein
MGPETKNDCAGEDQQRFIRLVPKLLFFHDSQSRDTTKYSYVFRWTGNQEDEDQQQFIRPTDLKLLNG